MDHEWDDEDPARRRRQDRQRRIIASVIAVSIIGPLVLTVIEVLL